jgi:subtilase family serine protease
MTLRLKGEYADEVRSRPLPPKESIHLMSSHPAAAPTGRARLSRIATALLALALAGLALASTASALNLPKQQNPGELAILLQLNHPKGLGNFVRSVSDPQSPEYGEYLTVEQLAHRFGAKPAAKQATMQWLREHGARGKLSATGTYVTAHVPAAIVAQALPQIGASASSTGAVADARRVPASLRGAVTAVETVGTTDGAFFNDAQASKPTGLGKETGIEGTSILFNTGTPEGCDAGRQFHYPVEGLLSQLNGFTPNQYLDAYGHSKLHEEGFKGQGKDIALVEIDGVKRSDVNTFAECFGLPKPNLVIRPVNIPKPLPPGEETTLDVETLTAAAPQLEHLYVYEGEGSEIGMLLSIGAALGSKGHHPDAISISLGGCEAGITTQLAYRDAMQEVFAVAAGSGISVLVAAGDTGSSECRLNLETGTTALPLLAASDPATSPYVTAVGGTNLQLTKSNRIKEEIVWNDSPLSVGAGGGGASILSKRPWYQQGLLSSAGSGRLVPDVAGLADSAPGYTIYCTAVPDCVNEVVPAGGFQTIGGTSAATPLFAGGVILADNYADAHNTPALGFLNPLLYEAGREQKAGKSGGNVLFDVTHGNNDLGRMLPVDAGGGNPLGGWSAAVGYDMASGWGSLNMPSLAKRATARFEAAELRAQAEARRAFTK